MSSGQAAPQSSPISFGRSSRPLLPVHIGRSPASMLLDTGAKVTCINKRFAEAAQVVNNHAFKTSPATTALVGANNKPLSCSHVLHVPIASDHFKLTWPMHVVDDLQPDVLAGVDLLAALRTSINVANGSFQFAAAPQPIALIAAHDQGVQAAATAPVKVRAVFASSNKPAANILGAAACPVHNICPGIVQTDLAGSTTVAAINPTGAPATIRRGDILGYLSPIDEPEHSWQTLDQVAASIAPVQTPPPSADPSHAAAAAPQLSPADRRRAVLPLLNIDAPPHLFKQYQDLLLEFADVISTDDKDLGFSTVYEHRIDLTSSNPVHVKQFRIPLAQQQFIEARVHELEQLRVIEPSTSPYNTPIFAVPKKSLPGEPKQLRLIQDLRALNAVTKQDKHTIADVRTCLDRIGQLKAHVFSSIDLRAGYYQMPLAKESRPLTAFTLPSVGQFQWRVTTMGLTGAPASFSKLMEKVMGGMPFILRYLDDILAASTDHQQHLQHLRLALQRLRQFGLKLNPQKSKFGSPQVQYLGHTVSAHGFTIGDHKFHAIKDFPPPTSRKSLQQFIGLANFFRQLLPQYQSHAGILSSLLSPSHPWKGGPLPPAAATAFTTIRDALLTRPVVAFPQPNLPFLLATDAAVGDDNRPGGLGAVLTQNIDGHDRVIAYASRALKQHEKKQSAFQLELQAVLWALDHFGPYLRHATFEVVTDHRPVAHLSQQQLKSLHRLHEKMLEFPCVIKYRPGVLNDIADALSRNPISAVDASSQPNLCAHSDQDLLAMQAADPLCIDIASMLRGLPPSPVNAAVLQPFASNFTRVNGLLAIHDAIGVYDGRRVVLPRLARQAVLHAAHCHPLAGHRGATKTTAAIRARYWWPGMYSDINQFVAACPQCQKSKDPPNNSASKPLFPLPTPSQPAERVHADLFGPLPSSATGNAWILTLTCALSKFVRVIPLPNKEASTVAKAIFTHWITVFGPMARLIHDQGKEFDCKLLSDLLKAMDIQQRSTSSMAPSVNGQAEVFNKWIASYLRTMATPPAASTWEGHLAPLNLAYNSAVHSAHNLPPSTVMFGRQFALPHLDAARPPPAAAPWIKEQSNIFQSIWAKAQAGHASAADRMRSQQTTTRSFVPLPGERVLLSYPRTALARFGPPKLQQQWKEAVVLGQLTPVTFLVRPRFGQGRSSMVHANRLKPFLPRVILPGQLWCSDKDARAPAGTQLPLPVSHLASSSSSAATNPLPKIATNPSASPPSNGLRPKKKRKRSKRHPKIDPSRPKISPSHANQDEFHLTFGVRIPHPPVPPPQPQSPHPPHSPYWLRSSPQPAPTPDADFFSASSGAPTPVATPTPAPRRRANLPRALQRLSTKLSGWTNPAPSSSSSSSSSTPGTTSPPP